MINSIYGMLKKIFAKTDLLAGICFFAVMILILANIIMRKVFGLPITGTFELVGLLTATGLGFALANCELNDGNIAMSIITDRLSRGAQRFISAIVHLISLGFVTMVGWRMFVYGSSALNRGLVSSTASMPIYPFIFLLGVNVFCLWMVLAFKLSKSIHDIVTALRSATPGEEKVKK